MKKLILLSLFASALCGCSEGQSPTERGGTRIVAAGGSAATLYIVEKDGYKFAVIIRDGGGVAMVQLRD